jgi:hypothetical protein
MPKKCEQDNLNIKSKCPYYYAGFCTFREGMVIQLTKCELIK